MPSTIQAPRRSKFNVDLSELGRANRTYSGIVYDSAAEARYAAILDLRKRAGDILDWWRQQKIALVVNDQLIGNLVADFKLLLADQTIEYVEIKGVETATWKLKVKMLRALQPKTRYTVVKAKNVA